MTAINPPASEASPIPTTAVPKPGMASLLLKGVALFAAVAGSTFALAAGVPDGNDYAKGSNLKHAALASTVSKKIVLVGGSNLAFGIDSNIIKRATHCPVVNMGMNGYFGVRFMLNEVKPDLKAGDIAVIALEYDSFYKTADGTDTDLLMVTKSNPAAFGYLTPEQQLKVIERYPYVAQQKLLRVLEDVRQPQGANDIDSIETLAGFTPDGDLVSHLGVEWKAERENGIDLVSTPLDPGVIALLDQFNTEMKAKGVRVLMSFSPAVDYFYAKQKTEITRVDTLLQEAGLLVPRRASAFVFPPSQHFDTVYHLNREGRAIRTQMLTDDILSQFGADAKCDVGAAQISTPQTTTVQPGAPQ